MDKQPENQRRTRNTENQARKIPKIPAIKFEKEKSQVYIVVGFIIVGCLVIFALLYPGINRNIRQTQIANTYANEYFSEKIKLIPYQQAEEEIKKDTPILVLFQNGTMKNSESLRKLLSKKEIDEASETIHVYPLIYREKALVEKYSIGSMPVFIYFVDGKEQNRYVFEDGKTSIDGLLVAIENVTGTSAAKIPEEAGNEPQETKEENQGATDDGNPVTDEVPNEENGEEEGGYGE